MIYSRIFHNGSEVMSMIMWRRKLWGTLNKEGCGKKGNYRYGTKTAQHSKNTFVILSSLLSAHATTDSLIICMIIIFLVLSTIL